MKKIVGWTLAIFGGFLCFASVICIPAVLIAEEITWSMRIFMVLCYLVLAVGSGVICRLGIRVKSGNAGNGIKKRKQLNESSAAGSEEQQKKMEPVYKPVSDRRAIVSDGKFTYEFPIRDLFPDGKKGLDYQELQWDFQVTANIAKHILDFGGMVKRISILGGCTEIYHTGTVGYGNSYSTLESFVEKSMEDIEAAENEAGQQYGMWFTGLDCGDLNIDAEIKETDIKVRISFLSVRISIGLENTAQGFLYLVDFANKFGAEDFDRGVGKDKIFWDSSMKIFRRSYQLEESRTMFLTSYMNEKGDFTKYSVDVETADDSHYEILPENMDKLTQILKEKLSQKYLQSPSVSCAYYLQYHSGGELIALLREYDLIDSEFHYY